MVVYNNIGLGLKLVKPRPICLMCLSVPRINSLGFLITNDIPPHIKQKPLRIHFRRIKITLDFVIYIVYTVYINQREIYYVTCAVYKEQQRQNR